MPYLIWRRSGIVQKRRRITIEKSHDTRIGYVEEKGKDDQLEEMWTFGVQPR